MPFVLRVSLFILFALVWAVKGKAQQGPFLFDTQITSILNNERVRANSTIGSNHGYLSWEEIDDGLRLGEVSLISVNFNSDTISWVCKYHIDTLEFRIPNDITLLFGSDRSELQKVLFDLINQEPTMVYSDGIINNLSVDDTTWVCSATKYDILKCTSIFDDCSGSLICDSLFPIESAINTVNDTSSCDGLYPIELLFHRYGFINDTIQTSLIALINATESANWKKWFAVENENLTVILEHPYFGFYHMLNMTLKDDENPMWNAELFSFIPSHNVKDLFGTFTPKEGAQKFEIK